MKCPSGHDVAMNELTTAMHKTKPTRSANIPTGSPNWMQRIKKKKEKKRRGHEVGMNWAVSEGTWRRKLGCIDQHAYCLYV